MNTHICSTAHRASSQRGSLSRSGLSRLVGALGVLGLLAGCVAEAQRDETTVLEPTTPVTPTNQGPGVVVPPETPAEPTGQVARRISVDQLRRSIPALFGGMTWTFETRAGPVNAFDNLARTLGEPDYIQVTAENSDPSALFAKFMDDMAGDVCTKAVNRDAETQAIEDRLIAPYPDDTFRNLRFLRLKLHGIHVPDDRQDGLTDLAQLHDDVLASTSSSLAAWYAVCVAMLTAPEFLAY